MSETSGANYFNALRGIKNAGEWALPYMGAAALSAPAYVLGGLKYGVPEIQKGYREGGLGGALGGLNEAARRVPYIGEPSVALMDAATEYAEGTGASMPAMFAADLMSPDPTAKLGALATAAKGLGALDLAVIPAFVGSPHRWSVNPRTGRLGTDMDKIGTGEGAQAFGYGHYSAENADVAQQYADTGARNSRFDPGGRRYRIIEGLEADGKWVVESTWDRPGIAGQHGPNRSMDLDRQFDSREAAVEWLKSEGLVDPASQMRVPDASPSDPWYGQASGEIDSRAPQMYGVLHDVNPEDLLDLDAPLSQQSPKVREALERLGSKPSEFSRGIRDALEGNARTVSIGRRADERGVFSEKIARDVLQDMERAVGKSKASNALREAGIPGSMYLDQMSRGDGAGTRNYVMFGDDLTYVDPSRTDPSLLGGLEVGAPWRTVEPDSSLGGLDPSAAAEFDDVADQVQADSLVEWGQAMDLREAEDFRREFAATQRRAARLLEDPEGTRLRFSRLVDENPNVPPAWRYSVGNYPAAATPEEAVENAMDVLRSQAPR